MDTRDPRGIERDRDDRNSAAGYAGKVPQEAQFAHNRIEEAPDSYRRLNLENIDDFRDATSYKTPDAEQMKAHLNLRAAAQAYAQAILVNVPSGHDRMAALDQVRVSLFFGNAAIALRGRV